MQSVSFIMCKNVGPATSFRTVQCVYCVIQGHKTFKCLNVKTFKRTKKKKRYILVFSLGHIPAFFLLCHELIWLWPLLPWEYWKRLIRCDGVVSIKCPACYTGSLNALVIVDNQADGLCWSILHYFTLLTKVISIADIFPSVLRDNGYYADKWK